MSLGREIGGYRPLKELGRGGMGVVFAAQAPDGRRVALKLLHATKPRALERFQREARALAQLAHPCVVPFIEVGSHEGKPFLVMDLVEGPTLEERLEAGPLESDEAVALVRDLARGLDECHAHGLLHRDVKPANILIDAGRARLTDFGLVKLLDEDVDALSRTGQLLGTPGYWSPEQAQGRLREIGPATDIYGAGAVLYACLTGHSPGSGDSLIEVLSRGFQLDPPSRHRPGLDPRLDAICLGCLAFDPKARFPSAGALADALEGVLREPPGERSGLRRALVGVLLLAVAVLCGVVAVASRTPHTPGEATSPHAGPEATTTVVASESPAPTAAVTVAATPTRSPSSPPSPTSDPWLRDLDRARAHTALGEFSLSQRVLDACLDEYPTADGFALRAAGRVRLERLSEAEQDVEAALELVPGMPAAILVRADLHMLRGDLKAALRDYEAVHRARPNGFTFYARARIRVLLGETRGAISDFTQALEREFHPDAAIWLAALGGEPSYLRRVPAKGWPAPMARYLRGQATEPSVLVRAAEPRDVEFQRERRCEAHGLLGLVAEQRGDLARARQHYESVIATGVSRYFEFALARARLASGELDYRQHAPKTEAELTALSAQAQGLLAESGDDVGALMILDHVLGQDPARWQDWGYRGEALESLHREEEAVAAYDRALELQPEHSADRLRLYLLRARATRQVRRYEDSAADFAAALQLEGVKKPANLALRGNRLASLERFAEAEADYLAALELDPDEDEALWGLGRTLYAQGKPGALERFDAAVKLLPDSDRLLSGRARVHWLLGDRESALADLKRAHEIDPNYPYSTYWRALFGGDDAPTRAHAEGPSWLAALAGLILGARTLEGVISQADASNDAYTRAARRCEAFCYAGALAEKGGDRGEARRLYAESVATGVVNYFEYTWSKRRLDSDMAPTPWD